jgi:hypothetical protein
VNEGSPFALTLGSIVDPGADTVSQIVIDWGDGRTDMIFSVAPVSHSYANGNAAHTISVTLVDEDGSFASAGTLPVNVNNVLPSFELGPTINVAEGSVVLLAPSIVDPGADTLTYSWQVTKEGVTVATGTVSSLVFTLSDNGTYAISLAVADGTGTTHDSVTLNAQNATPQVAIGANGLAEGSPTTFTAQVSDPGSADTHTHQWVLRDGLRAGAFQTLAGTPSEGLGNAVAVSGDLMVIGAYLTDLPGANSGAAFVFERTASGVWQQIARLSPSDGAANDWFGFSVAISGSVAVVGAVYDDTAEGADAGSAHVFERSATDPAVWIERAKLTAGDGQADDGFGYAVGISGDTVIVGAWQEDGVGNATLESGAAYIFERNTGGSNVWGQVRKLTAVTPTAGDRFGAAVAMDAGVAVVGTPFANDAGAGSGAAYVFERNQGGANQWGSIRKLVPVADAGEANAADDNFGIAVSVSAGNVLVGAMRDESANNLDAAADFGSAYLFERDRGGVGNYGIVTRLLASDRERGDLFGSSVAISGNRLVVGARTALEGTAYLFEQNPAQLDQWSELEHLAAPAGVADDHFGWSVSISSGRAVAGASFNLAAGRESGHEAVHVFEGLTRLVAGTGPTLQFTANENGAFRVSVAVTDDDGASAATTLDFHVANAAPQQVSAGPDLTVNEGDTVNLTAGFVDPGNTDTHTRAWQVAASNGQVVAGGSGSSFSFVPVDNGTYVVTLTVTDDDGGFDAGTTVVTVNNVAPQQVNAGLDRTVNEGTSVSLTASFVDPGLADSHTLVWQVAASNGQFVPGGTANVFSFTPTGDGSYVVTFSVTDDDGGATVDSVAVTVLNVAPVVSAVPAAAALLSQPFSQVITFSDPGSENWTASVDFGDGTVPASVPVLDLADRSFTLAHTYATSGAVTVSVSVNDGQASGTVNFAVNIVPVAAPTVDPVAAQTIPEGELFQLPIVGHTLSLQGLSYSLIGSIPVGASINSSTGVLSWQPAEVQGPSAYDLTIRVSDGVLFTDQAVHIAVTEVNASPVIGAIAARTVDEETLLQFLVPASDADLPGQLLQFELLSSPSGMTVDGSGVVSWIPTAAQGSETPYLVTVNVSDGVTSTSRQFSVTVTDPLLRVMEFLQTSSGLTVRFNRPVEESTLSLFAAAGAGGLADVTLVGATVGAVRGSLVAEDNGRTLTFIKTGGALDPDTYTLTLRSALDGLIDHNGLMLDGDINSAGGGDFVQTFTVSPGVATVVSIPDVVRGAGQPLDLGGTGIPITLSNGSGVLSVDLVLKYDPELLAVTGVALGSTLPAGSLVEINLTIPGEARVALALPTPLGVGAAELVRLIARAPDTAPYRGSHVLDLHSVSLNDGAIAAAIDDGVHIAAYVGDTTGTGTYSSLDATRILRVAAGLDTGFATFIKIDPVLIGDVTGNGVLSSLDATRVLQEVVGIDRPEIPDRPNIVLPVIVADPLVSMPTDIRGAPGSQVTVPVNIDNADLLESTVMTIAYDTNLLDIAPAGIRAGGLATGGSLLVHVDEPAGLIRISLLTQPALPPGAGSLLEIDFQIRPGARAGTTPIDLQALSLNEGQLALTVEPVKGADATDGQLTIFTPRPVESVSRTNSRRPAQRLRRPAGFIVRDGLAASAVRLQNGKQTASSWARSH